MRKSHNRGYGAGDMRIQIWDAPQEGTLRLPTQAIKRKPLSH
jgi:hypothetical protein